MMCNGASSVMGLLSVGVGMGGLDLPDQSSCSSCWKAATIAGSMLQMLPEFNALKAATIAGSGPTGPSPEFDAIVDGKRSVGNTATPQQILSCNAVRNVAYGSAVESVKKIQQDRSEGAELLDVTACADVHTHTDTFQTFRV